MKATKNLPPLTSAQRGALERLRREGRLPAAAPPKRVRPESLLGRGLVRFVARRRSSDGRPCFVLTPRGQREAASNGNGDGDGNGDGH